MAFEPDIIVTGPEPGEIALIAEVKTTSRSMDEAERQLKTYMATVSSSIGLLVSLNS
jgi:PD-(D/E)XK nuclease superfamily